MLLLRSNLREEVFMHINIDLNSNNHWFYHHNAGKFTFDMIDNISEQDALNSNETKK